MVSVLDRKLLRDLYQSRILLIAIVAILALGVMCFVTMQSSYQNLEAARQRFYQQCQMADFWVELKKGPTAELEQLGQTAGVRDVSSRVQFAITVDVEKSQKPINGLLVGMPPIDQVIHNRLHLVNGNYFGNQFRNEVIVSHRFAMRHGFEIGDSIYLILNGRREKLKIVGTALSSEFVYLLGPGSLIPDEETFGVFFVQRSYAEERYEFSGSANQLLGRFSEEGSRDPEAVLDSIENSLAEFGVVRAYTRSEQVSHQFLMNEIDGLGAFATVLPSLFLCVAAVVLNVLVRRMVRQQRSMIGTLKALGVSNERVFFHFVRLGLLIGILGSMVGSVSGYLAATALAGVYRDYFDFPDLRSQFHFAPHLIGFAASLACASLGSVLGARDAARLEPAEAMRPAPPAPGGVIFVERVSWVWKPLGIGWRMVFRELIRNRSRTAMGIFAASMGAGLLTAGFNLLEAQKYLIDFEFLKVNRSDIEVVFSEAVAEDSFSEVKSFQGVDRVEPLFELPCTIRNGHREQVLGITGLDRHASLSVPRSKFGTRVLIPSQGLVLGKQLAEKLGVVVGDQLEVTPRIGGRKPQRVMVARLVEGFIGLVAYADRSFLCSLIGETNAVTRLQLQVDRSSVDDSRLYQDLKGLAKVESISDRKTIIANLKKTLLESQVVMIASLISFAGIVFFGSVLNSSLISLAERIREVSTLRAMGQTDWEIGKLFLKESFVVTLLGTILGIPAGMGFVVLVSKAFETDLARLPIVVSWAGIGWASLSAFVFCLLAQFVVFLKIKQLEILSSLNVKE